MKKFIVLFFIMSFAFCQSWQDGWEYDEWTISWNNNIHQFAGFPTKYKIGADSALVLDFWRQTLNTDYPESEELGDNLLPNGDFHDFTMENDANTVGHWIFSQGYNDAEGGGGYIGEDWSEGGATYSNELISNNTFTNWSGDNDLDDWNEILQDEDNYIEEGVNGGLRIISDGSAGLRINQTCIDSAQLYLIEGYCSGYISGTISIYSDYDNRYTIGAVGAFSFLHYSTDTEITIRRQEECDITLSYVSVKKITTSHTLLPNGDIENNAETESLPQYLSEYANEERVLGGDFSSSDGWTISNCIIQNNVCEFNTEQLVAYVVRDCGLIDNKYYIVSFSILNYVSGEIRVRLGANAIGDTYSGNGDYSAILQKPADGNSYGGLRVPSSFVADIDNLSIVEIDVNQAKAPEMDGVNDYWYIPAAYAGDFIPGTGDFTIDAWVKSETTNYMPIVNKSVSGWYLFGLSANRIRCILGDGAGHTLDLFSDTETISDNDEHYVAIVVDQTNDSLYFYVDGVQSGTAKDISSLVTVSPTGDFEIGKQASAYFSGTIYEVSYSDSARTAQEIKESYGLAKGWSGTDTPNLVNVGFAQSVSRYPENSSNPGVSKILSLESGSLYTFEFDVKKTGAGSDYFRAFVYNGGALCGIDASTIIPSSDYTHYKFYFKGVTGNTYVYLRHYINTDGYSAIYDNIKVQKVLNASWDDGIFVEDFSLGGREFGPEKVTNGSFDTDTDWTKTDEWTIADGVAHYDSTDTGYIQQAMPMTGYDIFKLSFEVDSTAYIGLYDYNAAEALVAYTSYDSGEHVVYFSPSNDETGIRLYANNNEPSFSLDNLSIKKVTNGNHGIMYGSMETTGVMTHPAALELDGVNDIIDLQTPMDFDMDDFAIALWVKSDPDNSSGYIMNYGISTYGRIGLRNTTTLALYLADSTGAADDFIIGTPMDDTVWRFYFIYIDRVNNEAVIYEDGAYVESEDISVISDIINPSLVNNENYTMFIGAYRRDLNAIWAGEIGDFAIYKWRTPYPSISGLAKLLYNNTCQRYGKDEIE